MGKYLIVQKHSDGLRIKTSEIVKVYELCAQYNVIHNPDFKVWRIRDPEFCNIF